MRALQFAEAHAPRLKARASDVQGGQDAVLLANEQLLPAIDLGGQALHGTDNNVTGVLFPQAVILPVSGPVRPVTSGTMTYGSALGAVVSWTPLTFGRVSAQRRQARAAESLARDNLSSATFDERSQVSAAYLDLLIASELVRVQQQALARTEASARVVRSLAASGLRPGADSLLVAADVSRARIDVIAARRNATTAGSLLAELLGTDGVLPPLDGRQFLDAIPDVGPAPRPVASLDLTRHPRLQPFVAQIAVSDARKAVAARLALPRVSLVAGLSARGSGIAPDGSLDRGPSGLSLDRSNAALGVTVSVPLMDAMFTGPRSGVDRARAEADRFELAAQEDHLRAQVVGADANLELALAAARESPAQVAAATSAYQQMNSRYAAGLATIAELAQAQYVVTRAEADAVITRVAAWRAWLGQCTARGDLGPFLQSLR